MKDKILVCSGCQEIYAYDVIRMKCEDCGAGLVLKRLNLSKWGGAL